MNVDFLRNTTSRFNFNVKGDVILDRIADAIKRLPLQQRILLVFVFAAFLVYLFIIIARCITKLWDSKTQDYLFDSNKIPISSLGEVMRLKKYPSRRGDFEKIWDGTKELVIPPEQISQEMPYQFTYSFWLYADPANFQNNARWRPVLVKGNAMGKNQEYQNKFPGIYLAPYVNNLMISIATKKGPAMGESLLLENIPVGKWFALTIVLDGNSLDSYINGLLERSITLTNTPNVNDGSLIKGAKGGFFGHILYLRYDNESLNPDIIRKRYEMEKDELEKNLKGIFDLTRPKRNRAGIFMSVAQQTCDKRYDEDTTTAVSSGEAQSSRPVTVGNKETSNVY